MTASERREKIIAVLCRRGRETRDNLAFEFGVCKRTIDSDITALSFKYPIYTVSGNGGGIYIDKSYKPNRIRLTDKQSALMQRVARTLSGEDAEVMKSIFKHFDNINFEEDII